MKRPTYNHSRGDGPFNPCQECFLLMSRAELLEYASDLEQQVKDLIAEREEREDANRSDNPQPIRMLAEQCPATRGGAQCIYGVGHPINYHRSYDGIQWPVDTSGSETATPIAGRMMSDLAKLDDYEAIRPLVARINKGRAKYPNGCTVLSLVDEAGEVAHAVNKYETEERVRDELLDVAAVAMRLYYGEIDRGLETDGLVQRRRESPNRGVDGGVAQPDNEPRKDGAEEPGVVSSGSARRIEGERSAEQRDLSPLGAGSSPASSVDSTNESRNACDPGRPTFNHTRGDGPFDPCPQCLVLMSREDLIALVRDLTERRST